jgi:hypothetical protein
MKRLVLATTLLVLLLPTSGFTQPPPGSGFRRGRLSTLSMEEQARLRSAHDTAMRDPTLAQSRERYEQARREFRERLRAALVKVDPSVQPILEKVRKKRHHDR